METRRIMPLIHTRWALVLLVIFVPVMIVVGARLYQRYASHASAAGIRRDSCAAVAGGGGADWIAVPDSSPRTIAWLLAAAPRFTNGPAMTASPGTPMLVHPIHMQTGLDVNDCPHWLLPMYDATGHLVELADYVYDYPHKRMRFSNAGVVTPGDPRYRNPFPYLSVQQAVALLQDHRGVEALHDPAPELVFLPIDVGLPEQPGPAANWRGGGAAPGDPVWLLAGADGQDYLVGTDHQIYTLDDVPLS